MPSAPDRRLAELSARCLPLLRLLADGEPPTRRQRVVARGLLLDLSPLSADPPEPVGPPDDLAPLARESARALLCLRLEHPAPWSLPAPSSSPATPAVLDAAGRPVAVPLSAMPGILAAAINSEYYMRAERDRLVEEAAAAAQPQTPNP